MSFFEPWGSEQVFEALRKPEVARFVLSELEKKLGIAGWKWDGFELE